MSELKKIRVREAKVRDIGLFKKLWMKFLEAQHESGSLILPTEKNLDFAVGLFKSYVDEDLPAETRSEGVVLFVSDVAVLFYGDINLPYDVSIGKKVAYGWGYYVEPEHRGKGILKEMQKYALEKLSNMGFDAILGNTMEGDTRGEEAWKRSASHVGEVKLTGEKPNYLILKGS